MKIISWNLNGLVSCIKHGSFSSIKKLHSDILCFQEIRTKNEPCIISGYKHFWNHAEKEHYAGTATLVQSSPISYTYGFDGNDEEGRLITLEYEAIYLINAYVPNSQSSLKRKDFRLKWDYSFLEYVGTLMEEKPVIICGDFNVTRSDIDIFAENNRAIRQEYNGLISDERANLEALLSLGLCDVFRELYPDIRSYTWWSNRLNRRSLNRGWRLDYFLVSECLRNKIFDMKHLTEIEGSDHCPIMLEIEI